MKKITITICLLFCLYLGLSAQEVTDITPKLNLKSGKVSKEELLMSNYPKDTTVKAIVLFHTGKSNFTYKNNQFGLLTEHSVRIKILKKSGENYANVAIPYYAPEERKESQDNVYDIEAASYNLENGKVIKNSIKNQLISYERINDHTVLAKFTIPKSQKGSVIEYQYKSYTDDFAEIDEWVMQEEIPVLYNKYQILIPNLYIYNIEMRGKDKIMINEKEGMVRIIHKITPGIGQVDKELYINARDLTFTSYYIPALTQNEKLCWCPSAYKQQISFELQGTNFPEDGYKPYTQTWGDIDNTLLKKDNSWFGKHLLNLTNPFKEEALEIRSKSISKQEKIAQTFNFLKSQIAWNEKYLLYSKEPLLAKEKKSGSNADFNFLFISMLKDLGIRAYPVVLCSRDRGVLPFYLPSIQKLNTFVVAVEGDDKNLLYIDGSMSEPTFNTLPPVLLVDKARILNLNLEEKNKWVDLMSMTRNITQVITRATISGNQITGQRSGIYQNQEAATFTLNHPFSTDRLKITEKLQNEWKCKIENYTQEVVEHYPFQIKSSFDFILPLEVSNGRIYLNPMLISSPIENLFIESKRELPVEFPYGYSYHENVNITIPAGYTIEDTPENSVIATEDKKLSCKYSITISGNQLLLNYNFQIGKSLFTPGQYCQLQQIWNALIEKQKSFVVLKKI